MPPAIRVASPDDRVAVVALWRSCGLIASYNDPVADFDFALAGGASTILIAEDGERVVGSVLVGHDGHRGWLYYVAASPDARGCGIGRLVVAAGEEWLRDRGVAKVQLMIRPTNAAVAGFYRHIGYEDMPRILMSKRLDDRSV